MRAIGVVPAMRAGAESSARQHEQRSRGRRSNVELEDPLGNQRFMPARPRGLVCCNETGKQQAQQQRSGAGTYPNRRRAFLVVAEGRLAARRELGVVFLHAFLDAPAALLDRTAQRLDVAHARGSHLLARFCKRERWSEYQDRDNEGFPEHESGSLIDSIMNQAELNCRASSDRCGNP
jgi:hypothetical protein